MRSREENDITSNKLLGVIYILLHCSLSVPGPGKGFERAAGTRLAQPAQAWHWAWRPPSAPVMWAWGILAHSQTCCPVQQHISSQGRLQGAFQRHFKQDAQSFKTDEEHSTGKSHPLCSASGGNSLLACDAGLASLHHAILR